MRLKTRQNRRVFLSQQQYFCILSLKVSHHFYQGQGDGHLRDARLYHLMTIYNPSSLWRLSLSRHKYRLFSYEDYYYSDLFRRHFEFLWFCCLTSSICLYSSVSDPDQSEASGAFPWWFNQYTWKPSHWPLLMKQNSVAELINCLPFPSFNHLTLSRLIAWAERRGLILEPFVCHSLSP